MQPPKTSDFWNAKIVFCYEISFFLNQLGEVTCTANPETEVTAGQTTDVVEKFKLVVDLDSRVTKDVTEIAEKFPCHDFVYGILLTLVSKYGAQLNTVEFVQS